MGSHGLWLLGRPRRGRDAYFISDLSLCEAALTSSPESPQCTAGVFIGRTEPMVLVYLEQSVPQLPITLMLDLPAKWASVNTVSIWIPKEPAETQREGVSERGLCGAADVW